MKAEERRGAAVLAAVKEFGKSGYHATSTAAIAEYAGISQPYLFRLFRSKARLFATAADWVLGELCRRLERTAGRSRGPEFLDALLADLRTPSAGWGGLLRFEMALYAAAGDRALSPIARRHAEVLAEEVARASRAQSAELEQFFGRVSALVIRTVLDQREE